MSEVKDINILKSIIEEYISQCEFLADQNCSIYDVNQIHKRAIHLANIDTLKSVLSDFDKHKNG